MVQIWIYLWLVVFRIVHVLVLCLRFRSLSKNVDGYSIEKVWNRVAWEHIILGVDVLKQLVQHKVFQLSQFLVVDSNQLVALSEL